MKEKVSMLLKRPLFLVATGSMLLVIIFGILTVVAVPRQPQVVKRFCRALERLDEEAMLRCIYEDSAMYKYSETPEQILSMINPETNTVKCLIGQAVPYENDSGRGVILICICIYEEGQLKDTRVLSLGLEKVGGREYISDIMGTSFVSDLAGMVSGFCARNVDVETKIYGADDIRRTIRIEYSSLATYRELEWISKAFGEQEEKLEREYNVKIRQTTEEDVTVLYITQEGSQKDIALSSTAIFGNMLNLAYMHDGRAFQISNNVGVYQCLSLKEYTFRTQMDDSVSYSFTLAPGTSICDIDNDRYDRYEIDGRNLFLERGSDSEHFAIVAKQTNIRAICFWVAVVVFAVSGGLYVCKYLDWRNVIKSVRTRKKKEHKQIRVRVQIADVIHTHSRKALKQPVFWIAIAAIIVGIVFATISARQVPVHNYLVTEFCEELQSIESYEEADIEDFVSLSKYYNLHSPEGFVDALEALWNPRTQDLKCSIGEEYVLSDGKILVPVIMSVYRGSEYIQDFICSVYLKEVDGEMSIYSWNLGPHQENYREKVDRDVIEYYKSDPHDQDRAFYDFKQLEISTLIHQDGTYDREIQMVMSSEGWREKQAEVSAFLETIVPEGATYYLDVIDGEPGEVWFEVIQKGMTAEELNEFNKQYFGSGECYFTMTESCGESLFELHRDCVENIDFYYFYNPDSRTYPIVTYTIMGEDNYVTAANHTTNVGTWKIDLCESKTFEQEYVRIFTPLEMDIHTEVLEENRFCRTMKITLDDAPDQSEMEKIQHSIDAVMRLAEESFDTVAEVKVSSETIDGKNVFTLIQSGTAEQMSVTDYMLYRERTYSATTLRYEVLNPRIYVGAYENLNYYQLFGRCEGSTRYTMSFAKGTKMKYYDSSNNVNRSYKPCAYEIKGTDITVNITEPYVTMLAEGVRLNWWALGFWAMMSVAVVCFVLSFVNLSLLKEIKHIFTGRQRTAQEVAEPEDMWYETHQKDDSVTKITSVPKSEIAEDIVIKDDKLQELDVEIKF